MKLDTLRLLKNMESVLDSIFTSIKSDVKDKLMNAFILAKLSNIEVGHFNITGNKLIIDASKKNSEDRFELIFIPSFEEYNQIVARYYNDEFTFDKTISFQDDLTVIEEYTIDKYRCLNSSSEKRIYKDNELIYSVFQEKINTDSINNGYKHIVVENYLDGITSKSRLTHIETLDGEVTLEEYSYKKKDLDKKVPLDNKKEKSIYGTRKLYEESLTCSEAEFTKFTDYWKELHESYEPTDYSYLKKDVSKGML